MSEPMLRIEVSQDPDDLCFMATGTLAPLGTICAGVGNQLLGKPVDVVKP